MTFWIIVLSLALFLGLGEVVALLLAAQFVEAGRP